MPVPKPHHLIYGTLVDYLTGEELTDTDDERIRQDLNRMMVDSHPETADRDAAWVEKHKEQIEIFYLPDNQLQIY